MSDLSKDLPWVLVQMKDTNLFHNGKIEGLFICLQSEYESLLGSEVYFGEALGKHSEVCIELSVENLTVLTSDIHVIEVLRSAAEGLTISGYNPLRYLGEE